MRVCWVFIVLLSCSTVQGNAQSNEACKDSLRIACVAPGANVTVPCPTLSHEIQAYNFYKDEELLHNHTCNRGQPATCQTQFSSTGVEMSENAENNSFTYVLTGVNATRFGLYVCEVEAPFPPPFTKRMSRVLLLIEGHHCKVNPDSTRPQSNTEHRDLQWVWILGVVVLFIYGVTVTITAIIIWVKWRSSDSQSDYMNTKPKAPRDNKRKRGVRIPIPPHY